MRKKIIIWGIVVIAVVALVLLFNKFQDNKEPVTIKKTTTTKTTSGYQDTKPTIINVKEPRLTKSEPLPVPVKYLPDTNYPRLKRQYDSLLALCFNRKGYTDTARHDSSFVVAHNTVEKNRLVSSSYEFHLRYPIDTVWAITTETQILPTVRQLYINYGSGVDYMNGNYAIKGITGLTYKDRKDRVYTINLTANTNQQFGFEVTRSGKISLRRKR